MREQNKIEHNNYIESLFANLVLNDTTYNYNIKIHDGYGNSTRYLKIDANQLNQIKNILIIKQ